MKKISRKKIYLDYAATTPVSPGVEKAMRPYWSARFGNAGSLHSFGQEAIGAVDQSREQIAKVIRADFREIVFTGSATEANNLAIRGVVRSWQEAHLGSGKTPRIIVSSIEHASVLETARELEKEGVGVIYLSVDEGGYINMKELEGSLSSDTILVSIMYGNNEIGTVQPIQKIAELVVRFRKDQKSSYPLFHTDAVQAFSYLPIYMNELEVDLATFSAHKMYGPKGVGVLFSRSLTTKNRLSPLATGGGQEFGIRSGTENVPLIVGCARAIEERERDRKKETVRVSALKKYCFQKLKLVHKNIQLNGPSLEEGLPHILNVSFKEESANDLLIYLDLHDVAVSTGSACNARSPEPSHVLGALGLSAQRAERSVRFSFGSSTKKSEINRVASLIRQKFP